MINQNKKIIQLITHDGSFHTDDIFACTTLCLMLEKDNKQFEIIRTRDKEIIEAGDYVFDVGGVYNEGQNRFDHHQVGGAGKRPNDIEYSSFGLVWKKFGIEISGNQKGLDIIEKKLVSPVDAWDNGVDLVENKFDVSPYYLQHIFAAMKPTWREVDLTEDEMFIKAVGIAKEILMREIIQAQDAFLAEDAVISAYKNSADKRIIILDKNYPCGYTLNNFSEPMFVIYPRKVTGDWGVKAVSLDLKTFKNRKDLPKSWGGLRDQELREATEVQDAIFCHKGLFLCVAKTQEGAIKLAQIAVES